MKAYYAAMSVYKYSKLPLGIADIQAHLQHITFILSNSAIHAHEHSFLGSSSIIVCLRRKTSGILPDYSKTPAFLGLGNTSMKVH
jgi:hypothetical protein